MLAGPRIRKTLRTELLTKNEREEVDIIEEYLKALTEKQSTTIMQMSPEAKEAYDAFELMWIEELRVRT